VEAVRCEAGMETGVDQKAYARSEMAAYALAETARSMVVFGMLETKPASSGGEGGEKIILAQLALS